MSSLIDFHGKNNAAVTLVLRPDRADDYGSMDIDSTAASAAFSSNAPIAPVSASVKLMFTGVQILDPRVFDHMDGAAARKFSTTKEIYPRMLAPAKLFGFQFDGFWQDLGTPERIRRRSTRSARPGAAALPVKAGPSPPAKELL